MSCTSAPNWEEHHSTVLDVLTAYSFVPVFQSDTPAIGLPAMGIACDRGSLILPPRCKLAGSVGDVYDKLFARLYETNECMTSVIDGT